jgi:glycosyltransferase involved in cell wall biosynthesis
MATKLCFACFLNQSGYSFAAQNYILALDRSGEFDVKVKLFGDRPSRSAISDDGYKYFIKKIKKNDSDDTILMYSCVPYIQRRLKRPLKSIGMATFETNSPPKEWLDILEKNDAVVVPSQFNYDIFSNMGLKKPIYYIPHCIDFDVYNKDVLPLVEYDKYTFLFMGEWKERKGYASLVEAWLREFDENDGVQLIIKTDKTAKASEYVENTKKQLGINKGFAPILLENKVYDEKNLPKFIKSVDCFISPTMGEGFGYPGLQCMALKIPVIITNFSGCKDYADEATATLIEPTGFVFRKNMDYIPQFRNKKWAFLEIGKIQEAMRYATENKEKLVKKSEVAYSRVRDKFNYNNVSELFLRMVRDLYG